MTPAQLRSAREKLGLTQAGLAEKLGVNRTTVARWETGVLEIPQMAALAVRHLQCK